MFENQSPPEQQSADWETLASLTGFTRELPNTSPASSADASIRLPSEPQQNGGASSEAKPDNAAEKVQPDNPTGETDDLLDPEDLDDQAQTKSQLWTNPLAKGMFVAGIVGIGVGGIGLFLHSVQGIKPSLQAKVSSPQASQDTSPPIDPKQEEIAKLKTVNALGTQAQALKQNQAIANVKTLPTSKSKSPQVNRSNDVPNARRNDRLAAPIENSRTLPTVSPVAAEYSSVARSSPVVRPMAAIAQAAPISRTATFPQEQQQSFDPQTAWQLALNTGSYGQTSNQTLDSSSLGSGAPQAVLVDSRTSSAQDKSLKPEAQMDAASTVPRSVTDDSRYERDATAILSGAQSNYSTIGTGSTASATLTTPIVWALDLKIDSTKQFIVQLDRPMISDGKIVLEQGTRLIAQVQATSDSGAVDLSIVAIVRSAPDGEQMLNLPKGAISVTAADGRPLIADHQSRSRQPGVNFGTVLSGALTQVGSTLNQPQSEITTTSPYTSSTSVTNGNRNIVGSVLQGAFSSVSQQLQQRSQQTQTVQQQDFWMIPVGRQLQLTVIDSFGVDG